MGRGKKITFSKFVFLGINVWKKSSIQLSSSSLTLKALIPPKLLIFNIQVLIFKINRSNFFPPFLKEIHFFVCLFPWLQESLAWKRSYFVLGLSMFAVFGSIYFGFPGSGGLCTLVLAFVAGVGWSDEKVNVYIRSMPYPKSGECTAWQELQFLSGVVMVYLWSVRGCTDLENKQAKKNPKKPSNQAAHSTFVLEVFSIFHARKLPCMSVEQYVCHYTAWYTDWEMLSFS